MCGSVAGLKTIQVPKLKPYVVGYKWTLPPPGSRTMSDFGSLGHE